MNYAADYNPICYRSTRPATLSTRDQDMADQQRLKNMQVGIMRDNACSGRRAGDADHQRPLQQGTSRT